ncbi:MAG TPA: AraC family transcriptional regulator [Oscillospiraceae bacterium]|nr:AraC family transcriptional regulator [Oscillospiraceae bacterium]HPF55161.1 AraC family transcriptional regulator [Clostridiales bacterium]HPK34600.1 AraC family transcriptional regulator [Oscillospiraceae bacterium]HPR75936.1 AraC family transcriptional regulator [Oscillospiraceae bacterium]
MQQEEKAFVVEKLQEYIDLHIDRPITLKQLSDVAGYSPGYVTQMFRETVGRSPYDYVRARRLTAAALALRDGDQRVLDVALDFLFDSHEGFTRAFSKEFGIRPGDYKRNTPAIRLFLPVKAYQSYRALHPDDDDKEDLMSDTKTIFAQVIERPARKCLLKRAKTADEYFKYCEEVGCDVWNVLLSVKEALYEPIGMWLPKHLIPAGTSKYVQGVELPLNYDKPIPADFELISLPPCTMMVFQSESYEDEKFCEAIGEVWEHVKTFNPELYGYKWTPEAAPRFQLAPIGSRGYIEAYPVEKV